MRLGNYSLRVSGSNLARPEDEAVAFSWRGLPQYGARLLKAAFEELGHTFPVVASRPYVPIEGMERVLGREVHWVDPDQPVSWRQLGLPVPKVFFQAGWSYAAFNSLGDEVVGNGGRVSLGFDNNWRGTARQRAGAAQFRLGRRKRFAAAFVPGLSGKRLASAMGFPPERIWTAIYGADNSLFLPGPPLSERPPVILYVGQYIERKGCVPFAEAFASVADSIPGWELHMYGHGPLESQIPKHERIRVSGFTQPEHLASIYQQARVLALPSYVESWGLVVHEACLSGCQLLLSETVGSAADFATPRNSKLFQPGVKVDMAAAILEIAGRDQHQAQEASVESLEVAQTHTPKVFARNVREIVTTLSAG